jgi:anti-sigma B factor antagonist
MDAVVSERNIPVPERKWLDLSDDGDITIVRFRDRILTDAGRIDEIGQELSYLVERENRTRLIVSLASVDVLSSAALGKLIALNKLVSARGGALRLAGMNAHVSLVFSITRLDTLFDIEKDEKDALQAFGADLATEGIVADVT